MKVREELVKMKVSFFRGKTLKRGSVKVEDSEF